MSNDNLHKKPIRFETEGVEETEQLMDRMKSGAYRVVQTARLETADQKIPLIWIESQARQQLEEIHQFHNGKELYSEYRLSASFPTDITIQPQVFFARFELSFHSEQGASVGLNIWFDAIKYFDALVRIKDARRMTIYAAPPLARLEDLAHEPCVSVEFGERYLELDELLTVIYMRTKLR